MTPAALIDTPYRRPSGKRCLLLAILMGLAFAGVAPRPAHALRVVTWNLLFYPTDLPTRQPHFRTVMANLNADVLIAQELNSAAGRDSFLDNVLNVVEPGQWSATGWLMLGTEGGAVFYKHAKVTAFNPGTIGTGGPRPVMVCGIRPVGFGTGANSFFRLYSVHFKAGTGSADEATRAGECAAFRTSLNTVPAGTSFLVGGDTNFYGATEGGYVRLTESQADNDGRGLDPLSMPGTWTAVSGYAPYMTQSPCVTGCPGSGGGLDDRFDLFLTSTSMQNGEGFDYLAGPGEYFSYGNDGTHFNDDVNADGRNNVVPIAVANALHDASDHLPVVIVMQIPARLLAASALDFGTVLVGAADPQQSLAVSNIAAPPADELNYSFTAPAGFSAPAGGQVANAGAAANAHLIAMSAATAGDKSGTLAIASDYPDTVTKNVLLSGRVLRHAIASLDAGAAVTSGTLHFGYHQAGSFPDTCLDVHNPGFDPLQARLSVATGVITGGGGRFSIVGGFTGALVGSTPAHYCVHFDDTGANLDSTYAATLSFTTADEPLPGMAAGSTLDIALAAHTLSAPVGVRDLPRALRFAPPSPNPFGRETRMAIELPAAAPVDLDVFDLGGRRVASLASGVLGAGRHEIAWQPVDESGARLSGGLYFVRLITPGLRHTSRLVVLP